MPTALLSAPSPSTTTEPPEAPTNVDRLYRLSVEQYHAMAEAGILGSKDRIELIEGLLVTKMTNKQPHVIATDLILYALIRSLPVGWYVSMQNPIAISEAESEPEPDVQVVRGTTRDHPDRTIVPGDVALVVEVSESSIREDQSTKKKLYALASIAYYWIVNLPANRLEVYSDPTGPSPDYRRRSDHGADDVVTLILDGREVARIAVRDLLP